MSTIAEHIKTCREVLAVEIRTLEDSKLPFDKYKEKKLSEVFIYLYRVLENENTDEVLTKVLSKKITDNESAIGGFLAALKKNPRLNLERLIVDFNAENEFYRSILAPPELEKPSIIYDVIVHPYSCSPSTPKTARSSPGAVGARLKQNTNYPKLDSVTALDWSGTHAPALQICRPASDNLLFCSLRGMGKSAAAG